MKVINQAGRIMELSREEFDNMISMGLNLQIVERELKEIPKTNSIIYSSATGKYSSERSDVFTFGDEGIFNQPVMEAKRYKILPHMFFPDSEFTIWVDSNIFPKKDKDYMISNMLGDADIALFKHSYRENVYQEFEELKSDPRFSIPYLQGKLAAQEAQYKKEGMPPVQLYECNFLIRRNNDKVRNIMNQWWSEICRHSWRDQVSLPYVLWKYGKDIKIRELEGNIRNHKFFKYVDQYAN